MNNLRGFKQKLAVVSRLWDDRDYDTALAQVESLLQTWPGNPHLHAMWAGLVQLQDNPKHDLAEARQALQQAVDLDKGSPAAAIELGHFLDCVDDDPQAATKAYAEGVATARQLLIDGLIGLAKAYRQLDKRDDFRRCLLEVLHLTRFDPGPKRTKTDDAGADIIFESPAGHFHSVQLKGPYAEEIEELLSELVAGRTA
jgi:lipopolysaccharide biosynthesis regulator YciM